MTSFIKGPSSPFTMSPNSSALIKVKQHTFPSFSQLTSASLSPVWISAFSLISLGSTICPRSSTLINDSTLQQLNGLPSSAKRDPVLLLFPILPPPSKSYRAEQSDKSDLSDTIICEKHLVKCF